MFLFHSVVLIENLLILFVKIIKILLDNTFCLPVTGTQLLASGTLFYEYVCQ